MPFSSIVLGVREATQSDDFGRVVMGFVTLIPDPFETKKATKTALEATP
jgi:hypothetical protein